MNSPYPYGPEPGWQGGQGGYGQGGYGQGAQGGYDPAYGYGPDPAYGYTQPDYSPPSYPQPSYPPASYPPAGYPAPPPPYYPPPQRKSRAWVWILVVFVVLVVAAAATTTVVLVNRKPDITALTSAMTLPKVDFPALPDGEFSVEPVDRNPDYEPVDVSPTACEYLVGYPEARETVSARVTSDSSVVAVYLQIDDVRPDLKSALNECDGKPLRGQDSSYEVRALHLGGIPSWAIAETLTFENGDSSGGNNVIGGYYRGIYVEAWSSADDTDFNTRDLVDLFNAQVDRLDER
ncbi:MAG: hypothetical protein ABW137_14745 [Mycobacterium sp.]